MSPPLIPSNIAFSGTPHQSPLGYLTSAFRKTGRPFKGTRLRDGDVVWISRTPIKYREAKDFFLLPVSSPVATADIRLLPGSRVRFIPYPGTYHPGNRYCSSRPRAPNSLQVSANKGVRILEKLLKS